MSLIYNMLTANQISLYQRINLLHWSMTRTSPLEIRPIEHHQFFVCSSTRVTWLATFKNMQSAVTRLGLPESRRVTGQIVQQLGLSCQSSQLRLATIFSRNELLPRMLLFKSCNTTMHILHDANTSCSRLQKKVEVTYKNILLCLLRPAAVLDNCGMPINGCTFSSCLVFPSSLLPFTVDIPNLCFTPFFRLDFGVGHALS